MSIEPASIYDSFTFSNGNNIKWTIRGPLSGDLVAGLIVGMNIAIDDMFFNFDYKNKYDSLEITGEKRNILILFSAAYPFEIAMRDYIIADNIRSEVFNDYHPIPGEYGWWIRNSYDVYNLYTFESNEFVKGFISMCNGFQIDFRDYIAGTPFKYLYTEKETINFGIEGYDIAQITLTPRIPAPTGAYYIDRNEDDGYGVDFE